MSCAFRSGPVPLPLGQKRRDTTRGIRTWYRVAQTYRTNGCHENAVSAQASWWKLIMMTGPEGGANVFSGGKGAQAGLSRLSSKAALALLAHHRTRTCLQAVVVQGRNTSAHYLLYERCLTSPRSFIHSFIRGPSFRTYIRKGGPEYKIAVRDAVNLLIRFEVRQLRLFRAFNTKFDKGSTGVRLLCACAQKLKTS